MASRELCLYQVLVGIGCREERSDKAEISDVKSHLWLVAMHHWKWTNPDSSAGNIFHFSHLGHCCSSIHI